MITTNRTFAFLHDPLRGAVTDVRVDRLNAETMRSLDKIVASRAAEVRLLWADDEFEKRASHSGAVLRELQTHHMDIE